MISRDGPSRPLQLGRHSGVVSDTLEPLLRAAYDAITGRPYDPRLIADKLEALLGFLSTPEGRTNENCQAVDFFFCLGDWEWEDEPAALADILADLGGALHDTVSAPEIAANFESTPEQLLQRLRIWRREYDKGADGGVER